jgi:hypothetical protein
MSLCTHEVFCLANFKEKFVGCSVSRERRNSGNKAQRLRAVRKALARSFTDIA